MTTPEEKRSYGRAAAYGLAAVAIGGAVAGVAVAAGVALARKAVTPETAPSTAVEVARLERRDDALIAWIRGRDAGLPGRYSFIFDGSAGHARLGDIVGRRGDVVGRPVIAVDRGRLVEGARGRVNGWWFAGAEALGLGAERITYETELGEAEAWIVHPKRAKKQRWAVHVHGRGARLDETLRGVRPLADAGITSLLISYRNDPGAPAGTNGRYANGIAESRDVDAAIAEAISRGAERVTLVGWSMGGTAALVSATRGAHQRVIDGLILDSPAIDWAQVLRAQARDRRVPDALAALGIGLLDSGRVKAGESGGIPFSSLTAEAFARDLQVPVLIHASADDTFVPCRGSRELAAARPDLVQLRLVERADHVKLWNVDPEEWERATERFARSLPHPPWRG